LPNPFFTLVLINNHPFQNSFFSHYFLFKNIKIYNWSTGIKGTKDKFQILHQMKATTKKSRKRKHREPSICGAARSNNVVATITQHHYWPPSAMPLPCQPPSLQEKRWFGTEFSVAQQCKFPSQLKFGTEFAMFYFCRK